MLVDAWRFKLTEINLNNLIKKARLSKLFQIISWTELNIRKGDDIAGLLG